MGEGGNDSWRTTAVKINILVEAHIGVKGTEKGPSKMRKKEVVVRSFTEAFAVVVAVVLVFPVILFFAGVSTRRSNNI